MICYLSDFSLKGNNYFSAPMTNFMIPAIAAYNTPATGQMIQVKSQRIVQKLHPR